VKLLEAQALPSVMDDETRREIESLHPHDSQMDALPEVVEDCEDFIVDISLLSQEVKDLPQESGVGLSPWTNELIQLCCQHEILLSLIHTFVNRLINGKLPGAKSIWLSSRIIALKKPNGRVRPIAIADSWIRLGGRILSKLMIPKVWELERKEGQKL
jgi:hypothetical protein